jgi:hypothetical protein
MGEAFRLGGWGMYPTAIAGLVLVSFAVRYALAPDPGRALVVRRLMLLTFLVGTLGFTVGVIKSFLAAGGLTASELGAHVVVGVGESLHCIGLALVSLVMATIATTAGAARRGAAEAELADPHAP